MLQSPRSRKNGSKKFAKDTSGLEMALWEDLVVSDGILAKCFDAWKDLNCGRGVDCLGEVDQVDVG